MLSPATAMPLASRAFMRRTPPIPRLLSNIRPFTLTPPTHPFALFFSSTAAIRQATAAAPSLSTTDSQDRDPDPIDRSLIAPWFHELDDMPEERMCIVAPSTVPPAFPAMPVGDRPHANTNLEPKPAAATPPSGKRSIHTSTTTRWPTPDPPSTPYASDDPTQPGLDRNKQIRAQAAWQEMQQAGIACPVAPPTAESADTAAQPVADASNPTNAYGKLHPADTHGRGHIGLGEHELELELDHAPPSAPLAGNWDDSDLAGKDTQIRVPDPAPDADAADDPVLPQKPEDFVGACVAWHPVASMLFGHSGAARGQYGGVTAAGAARGYATSATPKVHNVAGKMPKVAEIVNPGGEGGGKPRIRQSMQETVRVKSAVDEVKTRGATEDTDVEDQPLSDEGDEYQDGAIRNPHKELSGN